MKFSEYVQYDGLGLAHLIARREVSAAELLRVAIDRTEKTHKKLNAVIIRMDEIAQTRAKQTLTGPFAGVPFLTKDLFQDYSGVLNTNGNKALKKANHRPSVHAEITQRWLNSGVVIFGRTNTPEFGIKGITEPEAWGASRNPWNIKHTPGGSSGGSAAAVAAGIVPIAGANDGGGSIRIPAACCGLFGLKPSRGRTPWGPLVTEQMHGAAMNHVVSRTVRDSAAMLDATLGDEIGSLYRLAKPVRSYLEETGRDPKPLRIAFSTRSPIGTPVDPEAIKAVEKTVKLLESLGHHVEEAEPEIDGLEAAQNFLAIWFGNAAVTVDAVKKQTGIGNEGFELDTLGSAAFGRAMPASEYAQAYVNANKCARKLAEFHQKYDLWLTPTMAMPPARVGEVRLSMIEKVAAKVLIAGHLARPALELGLAQKMAVDNLKWVPFTQIANITGVPAMSVPLHVTSKGLPMGVQFIAPMGEEGLLFQLAGQLERAQPWQLVAPFMGL
ncbi:MAG: amidase [Gammaproteobacteria bacterium]|nr:amidase [Gammaproteobacteria bacterium]